MLGELIFALLRIGIYFVIFYFLFRVIGGFFRGLMDDSGTKRTQNRPQQTSAEKPVQKYSDVTDAKFEDIPSSEKHQASPDS